MKPFDQMSYHPTSESLVKVLKDRLQRDDPLYFRLLVGWYFSLVTAQMRGSIYADDRGGTIPINMFLLNLAPTGFGKTLSMNLLEKEVFGLFRDRLMNETFPYLADQQLNALAVKRANIKGTDLANELKNVKAEYERCGDVEFSFASATEAAIRQLRHKLLMLGSGSINLVMDEVGNNMLKHSEMFDSFVELYDVGQMKGALLKNTQENKRNAEILGQTPTNLLMFGVPVRVFDGGPAEEIFLAKLDQGYARRCFFGFVKSSGSGTDQADASLRERAERMYDRRIDTSNEQVVLDLADYFERLADGININKRLPLSRDNSILLNEYQLICEERATKMRSHQEVQKHEMVNRHFKALKLAGAYAFVDQALEVTEDHLYNAIKLTEDSGECFQMLMTQDKKHVKLAKYIAAVGEDVTQSDLVEDLPFYRGSASVKQEMLQHAIAWGYKHNVIIKKSYEDGIEFLRGETLKVTDLSRMVLSYSADITEGYRNERVPFDQLHKLTQAAGMHWVAHHLAGGYRNEENAIPGFNLAVIDIDGGTSLQVVRSLMKDYKYHLYTTKRHTDEEHRFRLILPTNYELALDAKDYKEFMKSIFEWLPFEVVDSQTGQRARKWLSHAGHHEYNDGMLLDVLPFIPKTRMNEERKRVVNSQQSMDNLERWVINNIGDGNRNNMLLRYAMLLVDAGLSFEGVRVKVMDLNNKIADKLDEAEVMGTIMITVAKTLSKRP